MKRLALAASFLPVLALADTSAGKKNAPPACRLQPLKLMVRAAGQKAMPVLILDGKGGLSMTLSGDKPVAQLDERGCLSGKGGLWAELTPSGKIWTEHQIFEVSGAGIRVGGGATLRIAKDGTVERVEADGSIDQNGRGTMAFEGYAESLQCPAVVMLASFMAMMPSMAVSDGVAPKQPRPADSRCATAR
jgi:hypothetical protein